MLHQVDSENWDTSIILDNAIVTLRDLLPMR
jgi:hypothetical protein